MQDVTDKVAALFEAGVVRMQALGGGRPRVLGAIRGAALALALGASLSACGTMTDGAYVDNRGVGLKTGIGTLLGAGTGALVGNQFGKGKGNGAMTALGALAGGMIGHSIGSSLDRVDQMYAERAQRVAMNLPIGQEAVWQNQRTGNHGVVTPVREGYDRAGRLCREYQTTIVVGGRQEQAYGTACRQPDGTWRMSEVHAEPGAVQLADARPEADAPHFG